MKGLMNFLWHIPFLGFLWALAYAIGGVFACITIIFIPVGLAWFHIARYLLSPFSQAMVSKSDLKLLNPKAGDEGSDGWQIYCNIIGIIWLPFGALCCLGAIFSMIIDGISIIGIPLVYIWSRLLKTFLWPVNKVCVPITVANEIERIKANAEYASITGQNIPGQVLATQANTVAQPAAQAPATKQKVEEDVIANQTPLEAEVRSYDISKLQEIINNASMYNAQMVAQCRKEISIREESKAFVEQVKGFEISKLREIVKNSHLYSEALVYAAWVDLTERNRIQKEQLDREEAEARARREKEEAEKRERQQQWLKKNSWWIITIAVAFFAMIVGLIAWSHARNKRIMNEGFAAVKANCEIVKEAANTVIQYRDKAAKVQLSSRYRNTQKEHMGNLNNMVKYTQDLIEECDDKLEYMHIYYTSAKEEHELNFCLQKTSGYAGDAQLTAQNAKATYEILKNYASKDKTERAERERLAAEQAERDRIAAAEQAERDRIAAAEQAERDRIAAAEQAERDRIAAAKAAAEKAENERISKMLKEGKGRDGVYQAGDYYKQGDKEGIVFYVEASGRHGKIVSLQYTKGTWQQVMSWSKSLGNGWYLPTIAELQRLRYISTSKITISGVYWSSTESSDPRNAKSYFFGRSKINNETAKQNINTARAVCEF